MAKKIDQNTVYTYRFTQTGSVQCIVDGGSVKIWIAGTEDTANTYTSTGQAATGTFGPIHKKDTNTWVLNLRGLNGNNTVRVTVPGLGTWNPIPPET